jgi:hypothetical protein
VGQAVGYALAHKKELHDLSLDELKSFSALIQEDVFEILSTEAMIDRRRSAGGTATENVRAAIAVGQSRPRAVTGLAADGLSDGRHRRRPVVQTAAAAVHTLRSRCGSDCRDVIRTDR